MRVKQRNFRPQTLPLASAPKTSPIYVTATHLLHVFQAVVRAYDIHLTLPDCQFENYVAKDRGATSDYQVLEDGIKLLHGHVRLPARLMKCSDPAYKEEVTQGQVYLLNATSLLAPGASFRLVAKKKAKANARAYLVPPPHRDAEVRALEWAKQVASIWRPGKYILFLDGHGRNEDALIEHGIPAKWLVKVERDATTALYHRLRRQLLQRDEMTLIWTGGVLRRRQSQGVQRLLLNHTSLAPSIRQNIIAAYFDTCGAVLPNWQSCLARLPALQLLGLTRGYRNTSTGDLVWPGTAQKCQVVYSVQQTRVECRVYRVA